ncbi:hypothetical protein CEXT_294421 [Caerostris extrusa]|uniref:Uncharacterized protein n=1 Tax=Caerostris extrusa TaxID=172846 RepID=A0AAV4UR75_CAEEX|nr:hypothetical protein CEXT_294421 [Caerostris extrusa]
MLLEVEGQHIFEENNQTIALNAEPYKVMAEIFLALELPKRCINHKGLNSMDQQATKLEIQWDAEDVAEMLN